MAWYDALSNIIKFGKKDIEETNYKYEIFKDLDIKNNTSDYSSISKYFQSLQNDDLSFSIGEVAGKDMKETLYGTISTNKVCRLSSYRRMANFPEVGDAIDEICDNSITKDSNNNQVKLLLPTKFDTIAQEEINNAWDEYINLFDFENNMFEYMRNFVIEGELCWENIISKDHKDQGILNLKFLPPESYEITYDIKTKEQVGITVFSDTNTDLDAHDSNQANKNNPYNNGLNKKTVGGIQIQNLSTYDALKEKAAVFLPWAQVTYINTGIWNSVGTFVYPVLERARRAYNQLALIEDAIIIYRLVRAPERLVFNVDVGTATRTKAEQEVLKMMKKYNTKKIYNPQAGTTSNDYDPHSMIESFWFAKTADSEGTTVDTLGGGQNLGELDDLHYFLRKLYISLKIPYNRYENPDVQIERSSSINYEEYRFAKFIMRLHSRFTLGLKDGFKSHLMLKGIYEKQKIKDLDIKILFTSPSAFDIYESQQRLQIQMDQYTALADRDEFSKSLLMLKYLEWSKDDIKENWKRLKEDAIEQGLINFHANLAEEQGDPNPLHKDDEEDW